MLINVGDNWYGFPREKVPQGYLERETEMREPRLRFPFDS